MNMDCIVGCAHEREANANVRFIKGAMKNDILSGTTVEFRWF